MRRISLVLAALASVAASSARADQEVIGVATEGTTIEIDAATIVRSADGASVIISGGGTTVTVYFNCRGDAKLDDTMEHIPAGSILEDIATRVCQ